MNPSFGFEENNRKLRKFFTIIKNKKQSAWQIIQIFFSPQFLYFHKNSIYTYSCKVHSLMKSAMRFSSKEKPQKFRSFSSLLFSKEQFTVLYYTMNFAPKKSGYPERIFN